MLRHVLAGAALVAATLLVAAPKAGAGVDFSIGIGIPGVTYYEPYYPPAVAYPEVRYYAPRPYYGYDRGYGYGYGGDRGYVRYDDWRGRGGWRRHRWHRHHDCD